MAFVRIEDESGTMEVVVFPKVYEKARNFLNPDQVILLAGKLNQRDSDLNILADKIRKLS